MVNFFIEYAKTHELTIEPGFRSKRVRWAIICDANGRYQNVQPIGNNESGLFFQYAPHLEQPEIKRGGNGCRHFLVDTLEYVTRYNGKNIPSEVSEVLLKNHFFLNLLKQASSVMPILGKIADSMEKRVTLNDIVEKLFELDARKEDKCTFGVMGNGLSFLLNENKWHPWWREYRNSLVEISKFELLDLTSGMSVRPVLTHPVVSGLRKQGGQPTGDRLSSFKQDSFQSYNLTQSQNAAVSENSAWAYRATLDDLIENNSQDIAGASIVHWYAGETKIEKQEDPMGLLDNSSELSWLDEFTTDDSEKEMDALHRARIFLNSLESGIKPRLKELEKYRYYSMILSANSGRVVARDWIEGKFGELARSIVDWYENLEITNIYGVRTASSPTIKKVITCLLPTRKQGQKETDWIKSIGEERTQIWHAAISKEKLLPYKVLSRLVPLHQSFMLSGALSEAIDEKSSNRAGNLSLLYRRMGLLKAYFIKKGDKNMQPYLNEEHPSPAYHCGRLMAVVAEIQRTALSNVGAGVIQRYYAAASTNPALVFGRLVRNSNYHLDKIEYKKKRVGLTDIFTGIWGCLKDDIPKTLDLEEQSLFALGFYQQFGKLSSIDWAKYQNQFTPTIEEGEKS